jgi:lysophospholipase L1-like esterase
MYLGLNPEWKALFLLAFVIVPGLHACSPKSVGGEDAIGPQHASTLIAQRGETVWDLVALGDSTPTGYGVGIDHSYIQVFAGYIEEDLGVSVRVNNYATNSTRRVAGWVEKVRSDRELRNDLQNAEVIMLWMGWHDLIPQIGPGMGGPCYKRSHEVDLDCLAGVTSPMKDGFDDLLSEIVSLASPRETLIYIADVGIPPLLVMKWREDGIYDILNHYAYEVWRDYILLAASKHGVRVVHTWDALASTGGDQVIADEYMQSDGLHFNEEGHRLLADIHREAGYEYSR